MAAGGAAGAGARDAAEGGAGWNAGAGSGDCWELPAVAGRLSVVGRGEAPIIGSKQVSKVSKCLAQITQIKQGFSQKDRKKERLFLRFARSAKYFSVKIPA